MLTDPRESRRERGRLLGVPVVAAALLAAGVLSAIHEARDKGTPQMKAVLADPVLTTSVPGLAQEPRTVQHEGTGLMGKPHDDEIRLEYVVPQGADETSVLRQVVAFAQQHGWPLGRDERPGGSDEHWSGTKALQGRYQAEMSVYVAEGGPTGLIRDGVEEVDPTVVVLDIQPLDPLTHPMKPSPAPASLRP